jgi:hypothetical protein
VDSWLVVRLHIKGNSFRLRGKLKEEPVGNDIEEDVTPDN